MNGKSTIPSRICCPSVRIGASKRGLRIIVFPRNASPCALPCVQLETCISRTGIATSESAAAAPAAAAFESKVFDIGAEKARAEVT